MKKLFLNLFWLCSFLSATSCNRNYSLINFTEPEWPDAEIQSFHRDHSWPLDFSAIPSVRILWKTTNGHNVFLETGQRYDDTQQYFLVKLGSTTKSLSIDDISGFGGGFIFVQNLPSQGQSWFLRNQEDDPKCKNKRANLRDPFDDNSRQQIEHALDLGRQLSDHFTSYPNDEQPIPADLRQQIQTLLNQLDSLSEDLRSNNCY